MIPVCAPEFGGREREYLLDCIDTGWVATGRYIQKMEAHLAALCDAQEGVACSNGTTALHLALLSLGIGPGDEVILPAFTLAACANMIILAGARPVLADVDPESWTLDPQDVEQRITPKTRAIMAVHMYGHPCDMTEIMRLAEKHDLKVIEDCAQAHGAQVNDRTVGGIGHVGCFSFYGNKILTAGEGGALVSSDPEVIKSARLLRNQAFEEPRFVHNVIGFNYRLTNIQAAIAVAQLERVEVKVRRKRELAATYNALLADVPEFTRPIERPWATNVYWMYGVLMADSISLTRDDFMAKLREAGVDTRAFFCPLHQQPVYQKGDDPRFPDVSGRYPVSERLWDRGLYIPSGEELTLEEQTRVVEAMKSCVR